MHSKHFLLTSGPLACASFASMQVYAQAFPSKQITILAPAGTAKATLSKLNAEINKILAMSDVRKKLEDAGLDVGGGSSQQFTDFIGTEMTQWAKVAKDAGIQPE